MIIESISEWSNQMILVGRDNIIIVILILIVVVIIIGIGIGTGFRKQ